MDIEPNTSIFYSYKAGKVIQLENGSITKEVALNDGTITEEISGMRRISTQLLFVSDTQRGLLKGCQITKLQIEKQWKHLRIKQLTWLMEQLKLFCPLTKWLMEHLWGTCMLWILSATLCSFHRHQLVGMSLKWCTPC